MLDAFAFAFLATTAAIPQVPGAAAVQAVAESDPVEVSPPDGAPEPPAEYSFSQSMIVPVGSGRTQVSAQAGNGVPRGAYFPMRVFIDNASGPREKLSLVLSSVDGRRVTKTVDLREGERRTVSMLVPTPFAGKLEARAPGVTTKGDGAIYLGDAGELTILSLGTEDEFQKSVGKAPSSTQQGLRVATMPPEEAPSELAAYVGFDAVALPQAGLDSLSEGARRALEAYAATGGVVLAPNAGRGVANYFPLAPIHEQRLAGYGLGRVMLCASCGSLGFATVADAVRRHDVAVSPLTVNATYTARRHRDFDYEPPSEPLLPQATAPVGTFLAIISLFTLLIGPGSIWVARKRGPAALLVTIPGTALVTCALIVSSSILKDGFSLHASSHGYTELDSRGHRAISAGVTAYYANLSPSSARFDMLTAVLPANHGLGEGYEFGIDWGDSATAGSDFLPSRTYREWGYLSVLPTRARVVVKPGPDGPVVQNALGAKVQSLTVSTDDGFFEVRDLVDGSQAVAQRVVHFTPPSMTANVDRRLGRDTRRRLGRPLDRGQFVAEVEGLGFLPSAGLTLDHHQSSQIVRGEFE